MSDKPTVLILGGLQEGYSRALLAHLVPSAPEEPLVAHVRVVDKYLCIPPNLYTCYMDADSRRALTQPNVEYLQANLLVASSREMAFTPPPPFTSYDYIFDFSGESDPAAVASVYIERTAKILPLLGQLAKEKGVKAYVREIPATYELNEKGKEKRPLTEADLRRPVGDKTKWTHEGMRSLAKVEGLPLVVVRPALLWGNYMTVGYTPRLLIGEVYRYLGKTMEHLWSADLRLHTLHAHDLASACFSVAKWISSLDGGRAKADELAGESIPSVLEGKDNVEEGLVGKEDVVTAPVFNVVDGGDTTQGKMAELTGKVVGVKTDFYGKVINQFAKLNLTDVVEDANEMHCAPWGDMLAQSNPPIAQSPLSPYITAAHFSKKPIALNGEKIRKVVGWKPDPRWEGGMTEEGVREMKETFLKEGIWPNPEPKKK